MSGIGGMGSALEKFLLTAGQNVKTARRMTAEQLLKKLAEEGLEGGKAVKDVSMKHPGVAAALAGGGAAAGYGLGSDDDDELELLKKYGLR